MDSVLEPAQHGGHVLGTSREEGELKGRAGTEGHPGCLKPGVGRLRVAEVVLCGFGDACQVVETGTDFRFDGPVLTPVAVVGAGAQPDQVECVAQREPQVVGQAFQRDGIKAVVHRVTQVQQGGGLQAEE